MNKHGLFPLTWKDWDEGDIETIFLYEVEFQKDFGEIKKGSYTNCMINYDEGTIETFNNKEGSPTEKIIQTFVVLPTERSKK